MQPQSLILATKSVFTILLPFSLACEDLFLHDHF